MKRWGTVFRPGKTYGLYVSHLAKACQILDIPLDWYDESAHAVARGLTNIRDVSATFDNFIFKEIFRALLAHEGLDSEEGKLFYVSFVFLLRVQSEAIPMRRASNSDRILDKSPVEFKSVIGIRDIGGEDRLVLKLKTRKNQKHSSVIMRPCSCGGSVIGGSGLCPIHDFWPAVRRASAVHSPLFPTLLKRNMNRVLKASLASINIPDAELYTLKGFRRGCLMVIKRSGSTLAVILGSGGWRAAGFRAYLSLQEDEEANIKALLFNIERGYEPDDSAKDDSDKDITPYKRRRKSV